MEDYDDDFGDDFSSAGEMGDDFSSEEEREEQQSVGGGGSSSSSSTSKQPMGDASDDEFEAADDFVTQSMLAPAKDQGVVDHEDGVIINADFLKDLAPAAGGGGGGGRTQRKLDALNQKIWGIVMGTSAEGPEEEQKDAKDGKKKKKR
jgi:hypothetical protein